MREPGAILLVSCYELGHQPAGLAFPQAFLERAGFAPDALDPAVGPLDEAKVRSARLVAISVPMHTALRIGVHAADRIRALNPAATICFIGIYAALNRDYLLERCADAHDVAAHQYYLVREGHRSAPHLIEREFIREDAAGVALIATRSTPPWVSTPSEHRTA
jgi:hypothetical protein